MNRLVLPLLPFMTVWAYGCADSTEPVVDISGSWAYSATYSVNLGALGTVTCSMSSVQISLSQSDSSVSGTAHGGESVCNSPSFGLEPATEEDPVVIDGTVDGDSVSLEVDAFVLLSHEGTVSGDSISGTVTGTGSVPPVGSITVTGNWSASRQ